jgi:hypothetical protein
MERLGDSFYKGQKQVKKRGVKQAGDNTKRSNKAGVDGL